MRARQHGQQERWRVQNEVNEDDMLVSRVNVGMQNTNVSVLRISGSLGMCWTYHTVADCAKHASRANLLVVRVGVVTVTGRDDVHITLLQDERVFLADFVNDTKANDTQRSAIGGTARVDRDGLDGRDGQVKEQQSQVVVARGGIVLGVDNSVGDGTELLISCETGIGGVVRADRNRNSGVANARSRCQDTASVHQRPSAEEDLVIGVLDLDESVVRVPGLVDCLSTDDELSALVSFPAIGHPTRDLLRLVVAQSSHDGEEGEAYNQKVHCVADGRMGLKEREKERERKSKRFPLVLSFAACC